MRFTKMVPRVLLSNMMSTAGVWLDWRSQGTQIMQRSLTEPKEKRSTPGVAESNDNHSFASCECKTVQVAHDDVCEGRRSHLVFAR